MNGYIVKIQKENIIYELTYTNKKDLIKYIEQCIERRTKALIVPTEVNEKDNFKYKAKDIQLELEL